MSHARRGRGMVFVVVWCGEKSWDAHAQWAVERANRCVSSRVKEANRANGREREDLWRKRDIYLNESVYIFYALVWVFVCVLPRSTTERSWTQSLKVENVNLVYFCLFMFPFVLSLSCYTFSDFWTFVPRKETKKKYNTAYASVPIECVIFLVYYFECVRECFFYKQ